jgi:hypothetical protein
MRCRKPRVAARRLRNVDHGAERRTNEKSHVQRRLQRKACAPPRHHVHRPLRVRPPSGLIAIHPKFTADDLPHLFIDTAQLELSDLKAHGRAAVAAAAGQVEHDRTILLFQRLDQLARGIRNTDSALCERNDIRHGLNCMSGPRKNQVLKSGRRIQIQPRVDASERGDAAACPRRIAVHGADLGESPYWHVRRFDRTWRGSHEQPSDNRAIRCRPHAPLRS